MSFQRKLVYRVILFAFAVALFAGVQPVQAGPLTETAWLADNMSSVKLVYVGFVGDDNQKNFEAKHIPGSAYMPMGEMMGAMRGNNNTPAQDQFEALMGKLGISNDSNVVLYSTPAANPFVPGTYWLLKYFGHDKVSILNGSMDKWEAEGRKVEAGPSNATAATYKAGKVNALMLADINHVMSSTTNDGAVIVDTRGEGEYNGTEVRDYIKAAGHIPGAKNLNFYPLNRNGDGTYKSADEIKKAYADAGVTTDKEIIAYCEGGPRAADTYFALKELAGYSDVKVYVGSWMEWGNDEKNPVAK